VELKVVRLSATLAAVMVIGCPALGGATVSDKSESGNWLQWRGDRYFTGHSRLKGDITSPVIKWKHDISSRETCLRIVLADGARHVLKLPSTDKAVDARQHVFDTWGLSGLPYDLDGSGKSVYMGPGYRDRIAKMLPDVPGMQRFDSPSKLGGAEGVIHLSIRKGGEWVDLWQRPCESTVHVTNPIVGDFDCDGKPEIAYLPWYKLTILDPATGEVKYWTPSVHENEIPEGGGRAYGWFGGIDLNGDGNRAAYDPIISAASVGFSFKVWGEVTILGEDSFTLDDGSGTPVKVVAPGFSGIENGDYASAEGAFSGESPNRVLNAPASDVVKLH